MIKNFLIYVTSFLIYLVVFILLSFVVGPKFIPEPYLIYVIAIYLIIGALFLFGLIGPKSLRENMKKFNTWWDKDSALFFPVDPYKNIGDSLKEGVNNFLPTKERAKQFSKKVILTGLFYLALIIVLIILVAYFNRN